MLKKIKLGSSLAALILFAFPWLDLQCSEKSLATQSGLQVIYGGGSPSEELEALGGRNERSEAANSSESMGLAPLVGLAFIAVIGAVAFSTLSLFRGSERADLFASILPAAALLLLLAQLMIGFPAKKKILEEMSENSSQISSQLHSRDDEFAEFGKAMGQTMMMNFRVKNSPFFYIELLALGIPTLLLVNGLIDKYKKDEQGVAPNA